MLKTLLSTMLLSATLQVSDVAPDFSQMDTEGKQQKLSELTQKGPVVLAFFPKAFTSGCTKEMTYFTDQFEALKKTGAQVVAVSTDDKETLARFKKELKASFIFIPDPKSELLALYHVKMPLVPFAKRTTFVMDQKRNIVRIDTGSDAINGQNVLDALDKLSFSSKKN